MPLILGTNSIKDTGYDVANSLRFNSGSSDYLNRTPSSTSNRRLFTLSCWFKKTSIGSDIGVFNVYENDNNYFRIRFRDDDRLQVDGNDSGSSIMSLILTQQLRDISAWYHLVVAYDSAQGTASNRVKIYLNGNQVTAFNTENYPSQNTDTFVNLQFTTQLGRTRPSDHYFNGYMAEVCFIDGTALDPTSFGEFDEDTGIWKPINVSGLTFGTNGFYLDFENSGSLGADVSGNGNNFTVNNLTSIDQSTDTCTNNFCTINVLDNESGNITITEGNLNYTSTGGSDETNRGTFGFTKGKWYFESKFLDDNTYVDVGVGSASDSDIATPRFHMEMAGYYMLQIDSSSPGTRAFDNGSAGSGLGNSAVNDIHMFAIDMDNNKFYAGKNGTWYSSGDPANNSNPLITMDDGYTTLMPSVCTKNDGAVSLNFGSPSYAISSGNTDADGYGNFEYAVPSGYYALNTKNLAEYG